MLASMGRKKKETIRGLLAQEPSRCPRSLPLCHDIIRQSQRPVRLRREAPPRGPEPGRRQGTARGNELIRISLAGKSGAEPRVLLIHPGRSFPAISFPEQSDSLSVSVLPVIFVFFGGRTTAGACPKAPALALGATLHEYHDMLFLAPGEREKLNARKYY